MATKGPSFKYGNKAGKITMKIGFSWAKGFNKNTLEEHFEKHKNDFRITSKDAYKLKAIRFANTVDRVNCDSFIDKRGSTYKYNKVTNEFCIVNKKRYYYNIL